MTADPCVGSCRAKAVVCKAQKVEFGQAAAAAAVATSLIAGVSGRKRMKPGWLHARVPAASIGRSISRNPVMDVETTITNALSVMHSLHGPWTLCAAPHSPLPALLSVLAPAGPSWRTSDDVLCLQSAQALSYDDLQGLTYLQVKGSGIANTCPVIEGGSTNLKDLKAGTYK